MTPEEKIAAAWVEYSQEVKAAKAVKNSQIYPTWANEAKAEIVYTISCARAWRKYKQAKKAAYR